FERKKNVEYAKSEAYAGCHFLGTIEESQLDELERLLRTIPLRHGHPTWSCQSWI
ncbi:uncharacterized protein B0H18DRAFT_835127, partial [Fomitopsis serialis]|uniref:uncharacterized protein n=1 Tax=Fomitopsis serialis TaxID=139415 RepID=UPI0020088E49